MGNKLNEDGLKIVWNKVWSLIKKITGNVDIDGKGDLQTQIDAIENSTIKKALVSGEQTTASSESGGKNVYTFMDSDGGTTEFTVYNGEKGSQMFWGTAITGTSTTATIFSSSGVTSAMVNDLYLNTSTWNVYQCTVAGYASTAKWVYKGNIKGATGSSASVTKANVVSALGHTPPSYLLFSSVSVATSSWATYTASLDQESDIINDYPYKADVTLSGITANHAVEVNYGAAEIEDGVFSPYVNSQSGKIRIYANAKPTEEITIPIVTAIKKEE